MLQVTNVIALLAMTERLERLVSLRFFCSARRQGLTPYAPPPVRAQHRDRRHRSPCSRGTGDRTGRLESPGQRRFTHYFRTQWPRRRPEYRQPRVLYVGGPFTNAGGKANADYLAKWDGSSW